LEAGLGPLPSQRANKNNMILLLSKFQDCGMCEVEGANWISFAAAARNVLVFLEISMSREEKATAPVRAAVAVAGEERTETSPEGAGCGPWVQEQVAAPQIGQPGLVAETGALAGALDGLGAEAKAPVSARAAAVGTNGARLELELSIGGNALPFGKVREFVMLHRQYGRPA
jgi:hypothetical protein